MRLDLFISNPKSEFSKRYFLDCPTTSSATKPYISVQEKNRNEEWAKSSRRIPFVGSLALSAMISATMRAISGLPVLCLKAGNRAANRP